MNALAAVLALACPQGYVRVFADEGPPMAALLGRLIAAERRRPGGRGRPAWLLARLRRRSAPNPPRRTPPRYRLDRPVDQP